MPLFHRRLVVAALALTVLLTATTPSRAADSMSAPEPWTLGYKDDLDNTGSSTDPNEPFTAMGTGACSGSQLVATEWFSFTGTGRDVTVATDSTAVDTVVVVYEQTAAEDNMVDCNDDTDEGTSALVTVPTTAGVRYLVQVGGCDGCHAGNTLEEGAFELALVSFPPNDERADATPVPLNDPIEGDNLGAVDDDGEDLLCDTDTTNNSGNFGKTVWFKFTLPTDGRVVITASGIDTVSQLYKSGETATIDCNDQGGTGAVGPSRIVIQNLAAGDYELQVGGWVSPATAPFFAKDGFLTINVDFTPNTDHDGDGTADKDDCAPNDGAINPGARDAPGNTVDENCDGRAADVDNDGVDAPGDCDDNNANRKPGLPDVAGNTLDENCDGRPSDVDNDGVDAPADCDDNNRNRRPGVPDIGGNAVDENCDGRPADVDNDGIDVPADCNDNNANIKPGATDIPENRTDEDCNKRDAIAALTRAGYAWRMSGLKMAVLTVNGVKGMTIRVKCSGKKCFKAFTLKPKKNGKVNVLGKIKKGQRTRAAGSVLTLDLTEPMTAGKRITFTYRKNKEPRIKLTCLKVRTGKRIACPRGP